MSVVFALAGTVAYANEAAAKSAAAAKAPCGCEVKADAKVCGIDTDCCCTGEKATGRVCPVEKKAAMADCSDGKCEDKCDDSAKSSRPRPNYGKLRR